MGNVQNKHTMFFQNPLCMLNISLLFETTRHSNVKAHNLHITFLALS
jgi:hypothetical protein